MKNTRHHVSREAPFSPPLNGCELGSMLSTTRQSVLLTVGYEPNKQLITNYYFTGWMGFCFFSRMEIKTLILLFQILAISTVKPFGPGSYREENVALRGRASQSQILSSSETSLSQPINAIDGNRNSNFFEGSCSCTSASPAPWWRVDLIQMHTISSVTITNRGDCCADRMNGVRIHIGNSLENDGKDNPQCSVVDAIGPGQTKTFHCKQEMFGRYVVLYHVREEYLTICEVEVNAWIPTTTQQC
ncbi:hypothetical protein AAFF_G00330060 [Aldrovandia affinis]|uniref:Fucolectin tachylectin-4 pentraxin-1 domain-containing protein n=1 Tax=Aldrovandia affinis TaxID=143900 RepID=A0AAD7SMC0_9TELE|nr:hypothetical protein AAFF_G00330060 [Aldrovandia affinis]